MAKSTYTPTASESYTWSVSIRSWLSTRLEAVPRRHSRETMGTFIHPFHQATTFLVRRFNTLRRTGLTRVFLGGSDPQGA